MGRGEARDLHRAEEKADLRLDHALILRRNRADLPLHGRPGARRGVDRQVEFAGEHAHAADVIDVLVGDENAAELSRRHAHALQRLHHPRAGEPRVHQNVRAVAADVDGVAAGAAEQRCKSQLHVRRPSDRTGGCTPRPTRTAPAHSRPPAPDQTDARSRGRIPPG